MKVAEKRFAVLLAAKDSDYVKKRYGGYFNVFVEFYGEEGQRWDLFRVVDGEFPELDDLDKYDGFVVSGSASDAHGDDLWILRLCFLLQTLDVMEKKVLGICFGHQVLCRALGGRTGRAYGGWDIGLRKVMMMEHLPPCKFFDGLEQIPPSISIIECHQDQISEVPLGAEVIAFSERTGVEMFSIGDHILGIQGHPEYTNDIMYNLIDRLLSNNSIEKGFADDTKVSLESAEPDREFWGRSVRAFSREIETLDMSFLTWFLLHTKMSIIYFPCLCHPYKSFLFVF